jgi:hypothetical protein
VTEITKRRIGFTLFRPITIPDGMLYAQNPLGLISHGFYHEEGSKKFLLNITNFYLFIAIQYTED